MKTPQNPTARYLEIHTALLKDKRWWWDSTPFPFATIAALRASESADQLAEKIHHVAKELKDLAGWFSALTGAIRFVISAMIVQTQDTAESFSAELVRVRKRFRDLKIRNGADYEIIAATILRYGVNPNGKLSETSDSLIERFKLVHTEMSKHQWWLTSVDDYPACAILACQQDSPIQMCSEIEAIYQQLVAAGFWKGNSLQTAANLLFLKKEHPATVASTFHELSETFKARKIRVWQSEYDKLAILTLIDQPTDTIVNQVQNIIAELRMSKIKPRTSKQDAFNLACSLCFYEMVESHPANAIATATTMIDLSAAIAAQMAAIAAIAATTAATNVATNASS